MAVSVGYGATGTWIFPGQEAEMTEQTNDKPKRHPDLVKIAVGAQDTKRLTITALGRRRLEDALTIARNVQLHDEQSQCYEALQQLVSHINPETGWYELPAVMEKPF